MASEPPNKDPYDLIVCLVLVRLRAVSDLRGSAPAPSAVAAEEAIGLEAAACAESDDAINVDFRQRYKNRQGSARRALPCNIAAAARSGDLSRDPTRLSRFMPDRQWRGAAAHASERLPRRDVDGPHLS